MKCGGGEVVESRPTVYGMWEGGSGGNTVVSVYTCGIRLGPYVCRSHSNFHGHEYEFRSAHGCNRVVRGMVRTQGVVEGMR